MHIRYARNSRKNKGNIKYRTITDLKILLFFLFFNYLFDVMKKKMLQFVDLKQETPEKRSTSKRKSDFNEIYNEFITDKAKEQSSRCSQCGVPFCQIHCPLGNNIPDWLKLTAEGRLQEHMKFLKFNNMPEVCGRICPQDRLCEGNCVIEQQVME